MNNETNMPEIKEVVETGTEMVTKVAGNGDLMKKIGVGAGFAVAGALVYEGGKRLIGLIKSKAKAKKHEDDKSEASDKKAKNIEG